MATPEKIYITPNVLKGIRNAMEDISPGFAENPEHDDCPLLELARGSDIITEPSIPNSDSSV